MTCEHLIALEEALLNARIAETFRGAPWSENCREWVYFDCYLPAAKLREKFKLDSCVTDHEHFGTHDGQEAGFVCSVHHDAVLGHHPKSGKTAKKFSP